MGKQGTPFAVWQKWLIGVLTAGTLSFSGWAATTLFGIYTTVIELKADMRSINKSREDDKAEVDRRFGEVMARVRDLERGARTASRAD